jgi:polyhydroxybutyrate depolymerase
MRLCMVGPLSLVAAAAIAFGNQRTARAPAEQTLTHDGRSRTYLIHDFARGPNAPAVIILHGGGGNAENAVRMTGFDRIAQREGLIAVYPNGTSGPAALPLLTWNAGHCCAAAMEAHVDDVGFVAAIVDTLVAKRRADPSRIYVTGMSNGAMMTHRLGRELSTRIAAIAPVVGALFGDERPPVTPVAAFIIVGADDRTVPGAGGPLTLRLLLARGSAADRNVAPAIDQATYWARANGCGAPRRSQTRASAVLEWNDCSSGAPVVFHTVAGNGHAWPGGQPGRASADPPSKDFDASEAIWTFFKTQQRTSVTGRAPSAAASSP